MYGPVVYIHRSPRIQAQKGAPTEGLAVQSGVLASPPVSGQAGAKPAVYLGVLFSLTAWLNDTLYHTTGELYIYILHACFFVKTWARPRYVRRCLDVPVSCLI